MKSLILKEAQKLNYNNPISPPGNGRGELEITDVNNEYIRQEQMGYSVLDGYWSDAGTFESLLRAGWLRSFEKMRRNMTIMITSGAGFIGSHLCERLLAKGGVVCPLTGSQKDMACVKVDGEQYFLRQGESTVIRDGVKHGLSNPGKVGLEIVGVQPGEYLGEDDIVRFGDE